VQQITAASHEQRTGVEQITQAMCQLDQIAQQKASAAETLSSTANQLSLKAEELMAAVDFFKIRS
jgi:methyl-accepting chemotaxis protein